MNKSTKPSKALVKTDVMQSVLFEDDLVTYETALLAREKGFDIDCGWKIRKLEDGSFTHTNCSDLGIEQPTQSLLQKWLREKHHKRVEVKSYFVTELMYFVSINTDSKDYQFDKEFQTYEKALEFGLFECLQIVSETVA